VSEGGRPLAILPLYEFAARPLRVLRFVGHGAADELGPVCAPQDRLVAARAMRNAAAELGADVSLAERLVADDAWSAMLGGHVVARDGSPVLDLSAGSWSELTATWSANLRQQVGRKERKLTREHDISYRLVTEPEDLQPHLETLFVLHAACWGERGTRFVGTHTPFHRDFARVAAERGWLRLWLLEVDGRTVAAMLVYRFGGADCFYQSGRDPEWDRASVGMVLMTQVIRAALDDGMEEYRFLRGNEAYKYRFASRDPAVETVAVTARPRGAAVVAARRMVPDPIGAPLRRWVNR
jgi:CelD/BcsL family acetyltransferase involved in cellulose biosynthesis